jgi:hypothetical protein
MAKVWASVYPTGTSEYTKSKEELLQKHEIPFVVSDDTIHFITDEYSVDVASREYNKPYSLFCMRLCDSSDGGIGMGEGSLEKEEIDAIGEVFGEDADLAVTFSVGSAYGDEEVSIWFVKDEDNGGYKLDCDVESYDFEDEDEDEWL